jgi:hypothetical protein
VSKSWKEYQPPYQNSWDAVMGLPHNPISAQHHIHRLWGGGGACWVLQPVPPHTNVSGYRDEVHAWFCSTQAASALAGKQQLQEQGNNGCRNKGRTGAGERNRTAGPLGQLGGLAQTRAGALSTSSNCHLHSISWSVRACTFGKNAPDGASVPVFF